MKISLRKQNKFTWGTMILEDDRSSTDIQISDNAISINDAKTT